MIHFAIWLAALLFLCYLALFLLGWMGSIIASMSDASSWRKRQRDEASKKSAKPTGTHIKVMSVTPNN